jgi:hypothetical protein
MLYSIISRSTFIISFVLCNCFFLWSCDLKLWQFKKSCHNSCMRIMFMVYGCILGGCTQVTWTARYFNKQWKSTKLLVMHWCTDDAENSSMKRLFYFCCRGIQRVCDDRQILNRSEVVCGQQNKKDLGKLSFLTVWEGGWNEVQSCHSYGA